MTHYRQLVLALALGTLTTLALTLPPRAAVPDRDPQLPGSWPMFGGSPARNMVNLRDKNLPTEWCVEEGKFKNVKWTAEIGTHGFGSPVVADGMVFVGTNNGEPKKEDRKVVLKAFRESDGKLLWQNAHAHPAGLRDRNWIRSISTPTVERRRIYYVTPFGDVICANNADGKIVWRYDMIKELKVRLPDLLFCGAHEFSGNLCSPLIVGDLVFVVTNNGVDDEGTVPAPDAPSFVALDKNTGKLAWQSNLPGARIIDGSWSSPAFANLDNVPQVIFAGGDSVIYSFEPRTGKLLWKCDCLLTREIPKGGVNPSIVGTPVIVGDRLYVGLGTYPDRPFGRPRFSYFLCLDITKRGDVSFKSYEAKAAENKDSALVWAFGGRIEPVPAKGREALLGPTTGTAAVHDGLLYISEENGYLHCLAAKTGNRCWEYDLKACSHGSPFWVDGKIYVGTDEEIFVFQHGRDLKLLAKIEMDDLMHTTPVASNGVLYLMTKNRLYAIAHDK